ncbi:MAG: hypothetical protein QOG53_3473 [Frankiales bacterium]|jgi:hypothetical protein|nr:hypothetical protein [Frankiales bacterium]
MRRVFAVAAGLAALGTAATIGATAAIGAGDPDVPAVTTAVTPQQIADSLATNAGRSLYDVPTGTLVSATVCVASNCVTKHYAAAPTCNPSVATCIGTAMVAQKYANAVTITFELV